MTAMSGHILRCQPSRPVARQVLACGLGSLLCLITGCASWTNPVANGIPVRMLPPELLAEPKDNLEPIRLTHLRRKPVDQYRLGPEDVLGVYIEGVLGAEDQLPPVNVPQSDDLPPSIGFPIPVREDGTLPLPLIDPLDVDGLTVAEAQQAMIDAYTAQGILQPNEARVLVTVMRPRNVQILVIRQDSPEATASPVVGRSIFGSIQSTGSGRRGTGAIVELPSTEADLLAVLAQTGGLPGSDAKNEVVIQRGYAGSEAFETVDGVPQEWLEKPADGRERRTVRIPLRMPAGTPPPLEPEDIVLKDGDIVFIEARDTEFYYTGGFLPSLEMPLPRDYDLDVVEAVAQVGGTLVRGGNSTNNLSGTNALAGIGAPSPSLLTVLRRLPDGRQIPIRVDLNQALREPRANLLVKSGDVLILQETPGEAFNRYLADVITLNFIGQLFNRGSGSGTASVLLP